jgi:hypothetical protein
VPWAVTTPAHDSVRLPEGPDTARRTDEWVNSADLLITVWYADRPTSQLIAAPAATGKSWCYWGGASGVHCQPLLSRLGRWWLLRPLRRSRTLVWGSVPGRSRHSSENLAAN